MKTMSDYLKHPENITGEEWQNYVKLIESVKEFGKSIEGYNVEINSNNTINRISSRFYQENFVMSAVLEAFYNKDQVSFKELNEYVLNYVPKEFIWKLPVTIFQTLIIKMIRLGLIIPVESENKYIPIFKISDDGTKALQQQTFQTLAASSFYNYQTFLINKRSMRINVYMLIVTIMSVIVTVLTILKSSQ